MRAENGMLAAVGGAEDHLHLLASLHKTHSISEDMATIKANSSRWVHETFPALRQFAWQEGFGAFTVSHSGLARIEAYIARQDEHHRRVTFQDEFIEFLERHKVKYDSRYIWD